MHMIELYILMFTSIITINSQSIRLAGGSNSYSGRIEIHWYTSGCWLFCEDRWEWGTVCDDYFDINDAHVACRSLGYVGAVSYGSFGAGGGPTWLDDVHCSGHESYLWHCSTSGWGNENCGKSEDVGVTCDINHCTTYYPCQNGAQCIDGVGTYTCSCTTGYTGTNCETDINECASHSCSHGSCVDGIATYTCSCYAGYTSTYCETNIDECASGACQNGAVCTDLVNQYSCTCLPGYTGIHCETNIDECASNPCQNGGQCTDEVNRYTCTCVPGYDGVHCENNINECASSPCQNGATCVDAVNQYACTCVAGYIGTYCETDFDECASAPCQNDGTCFDQLNGYFCNCVTWYYEYNCASLDTSYSHSTLTRFANYVLWNKHYTMSHVRSEIECIRACLRSENCLSINYKVSSGMCEISSTVKADHSTDFKASSAYVYYEKVLN